MNTRMFSRLIRIGVLGLILVTIHWALATSNSIAESGLFDADVQNPITPDDLKPPECSGIMLDNLVQIGVDTPTNGNDLILGTSGSDTIDGRSGDDCIVGGGGDDSLSGGNGDDVILGGDGADQLYGDNKDDTLYGGSGDDLLDGGNKTDVCYGEAGTDTFVNCETEIQ